MFIDVKLIRIATLSNEEVSRVPVFVSVANLNIKQIPGGNADSLACFK